MQKSRCRRWLELRVLSGTVVACALACGSPQVPRPTHAAPTVRAAPDELARPRSALQAADPAPELERKPVPAPAPPVAVEQPNEAGGPEPPAPSAPAELPRGTVVLHVGDSFAAALGIPLSRLLKQAGLRSVLEFHDASYVPTWAHGSTLPRLLARHNPDLVLVTLGGNEFEIPEPQQRVPAIRRLVSTLSGRACVWVFPPRWKKDTGLFEVVREHAAPCRFLDSDTLVPADLPRKRDRIHPSTNGGEIWATAVFEWLARTRDPAAAEPWVFRTQNAP
jgi:acyl-CoA thioesterase-1